MRILIIEDEEAKRLLLEEDLEEAGYDAAGVMTAEDAVELLKKESFDLAVTDLKLPGKDGLWLLKEIRRNWPRMTVVMMTAYATVETAIQAMKSGAYDYLTKPFSSEELLLVIDRVRRLKALENENLSLHMQLRERYSMGEILGQSPAMQKVFDLMEICFTSDTTVLLEGETGTGKDLVASVIHYNSQRKNYPFVKMSCAALPHTLIESELFGHEKGAFTGAVRRKSGRVELAQHGTVFLDEVDDIPSELQVKLLRFLDEKTIERVGGTALINVDVRIIAATKVDLKEKARKGEFRDDLFYRLNVLPIRLPPLRERKEDIPLLIEHFLKKSSPRAQVSIEEDALRSLTGYSWPGNVRELKHLTQQLTMVKTGEKIRLSDIPAEIRNQGIAGETVVNGNFDNVISAAEKKLILKALQDAGGNKSRAAALLGLPLSTFRDKLAKYQ